MNSQSPQSTPTLTGCCPDWITPELIQETLDVWNPYYQEQLTESDAIEILMNVGMLLEKVSVPEEYPTDKCSYIQETDVSDSRHLEGESS